ncbi:dipeptidase 1-like [Phlebotomus argentipes]|uniref:dipeptidase 1-like n=1 Tax=Phlebotomus argentipes TaxID=94469 RepID=UPI00289359E8|nr:dipeptidase 1-like [Phlebotomus argentipes]
MLMTSGQWDVRALEALEREASDLFDVLDVPERLRPPPAKTAVMDLELQDHIKHCSCSCNHMGYGNYMDYQQTSCFGGLPDVTEHTHSNRTSTHKELSSSTESLAVNNSTPGERHSMKSLTPPSTQSSIKDRERGSAAAENERKWCFFVVTFFVALTVCVVILSLLVEVFLGQRTDRSSQALRIDIVRRLLEETPLIDGHNDLPWNIKRYSHNRLEYLNFTEGVRSTEPWSNSQWSHTDIPRLRQGLIGAQFWSAYVPCEAQGLDAVQLALEQIDVIQRFTELYDKHTALAQSSQDIITMHRRGLFASLIGVEGGHALGSSLGVLRSLYDLGVRYLTLTHTCDNTWAGAAPSNDRGLTAFGRAVVKEMNRIGVIIDLSHSSDATAKDVLEATRAPVMFSHSAARALCNATGNIGDDILRLVADNGGIVMVSFYALHVACSRQATVQDVIQHIRHIRAVAGIQHVGIGAGFDGIDATPMGLEDVSKYPELFASLLEDSGWTENDIGLLAGKNFLRVFKSVENVRDYWKSANILPNENVEPPKKSPCAYMPL